MFYQLTCKCVVISIITLVLERGDLRRHSHEISRRQATLGIWNLIEDQYRVLPVHSLENLVRFKVRDFFLFEVLSLDTQATLHKIVCAPSANDILSRSRLLGTPSRQPRKSQEYTIKATLKSSSADRPSRLIVHLLFTPQGCLHLLPQAA